VTQRHLPLCLLLCAGAISIPCGVWADSPAHKVAQFASGDGNLIYLGLGVGLPLAEDSSHASNDSLRALDSVGSSVLVTEALKNLTHERRPDATTHDSFPSGHATAAFAVATAESASHPNQAALWYLGATAIAASRIELHRHYLQDVLVGAIIGFGVTRLELSSPRGFLVGPFVKSHQGQISGFSFSLGF
jgi:membrane-associated phospholipid phosphatase